MRGAHLTSYYAHHYCRMKMSLGVDGLFTTIRTAVSFAKFYTNKLNSSTCGKYFFLNLLIIELGEKMLFSLLEMHFDVETGMMKRAFLQHLQFASVNKGYLPK